MIRPIIPALALFALASPVFAAPVEVTRFIATGATLTPAHGSVGVTTTPGVDPTDLAMRPWLDAVSKELAATGYGPTGDANPDLVAEVRVERHTEHIERERGPVSVGVGGETGTYHSGFGLGIGFSLGGGAKDIVSTRLVVTLKDRATGANLWEARADSSENAKRKEAQVDVAAPRLAHALFAGFPGRSGETIKVK